MVAILTVSVCLAVLSYAAWQYALAPSFKKTQNMDNNKFFLVIIIAAAFLARIICAASYTGHPTDMGCFTGWADNVFKNGVGQFYKSAGFTDYPPGYMYILWVLGAVKSLFSIQGNGYYFLVKLPAIIADLVTGYLIYKIANKKLSNGISALLAALYVFNPAVITDSALWGQVDSVYTLALLIMIWLIAEQKLELSYFAFAACILIKPQAFIYTPIIAYGIINKYIYPEFKLNALIKSLAIGIGAIAAMVLIAMPFGLQDVINQYVKAISEEYLYFTINAFNFWGMLGMNWKHLTGAGTVIGYFVLAAIVAYATYIFFKSKNQSKYYYAAAILAFFTYMLSTKMHERYGFPVMVFLLLAVIETKNIHVYALYVLTSLTQFFNYAWILFIYQQDINKYAFSNTVKVASAVNVALLLYMIFVSQKLYAKNQITVPKAAASGKGYNANYKKNAASKKPSVSIKKSTSFHFATTKALAKITKIDLVIIAAIMVVYSAVALYDLGDMDAPQTNVLMQEGASRIELSESADISQLRLYIGNTAITSDNPIIVMTGESDTSDDSSIIINSAGANAWTSVSINQSAKYITLLSGGEAAIGEAEIYSSTGEKLSPQNTHRNNASALFDEEGISNPTSDVLLNSAVVDLGKDYNVSKIRFFLGASHIYPDDRPLIMAGINSRGELEYTKGISHGSVFYWNTTDNIGKDLEKLIFAATCDSLYLNEIGILDNTDKAIAPVSYSDSEYELLFDEQSLIPDRPNFRNGTYFDEIYHARTAYEFTQHMSVYEWTHPPLGKVFIALGILIFGMCPFGWRIAGTVFGIFMIPIIYIFAKKMFNKSWLAVITCLLFTFDFMHFAQTRIATIDVYVTFFIMLMYLFMYKYATMSFYDTPLKKTFVPLALCGISMGFGIASKWTGIYAGAGLAVIFFAVMIMRYREYAHALKTPSGETDGILHKDVIDSFYPNFIKTVGWCLIFFVAVPAIIYGLSYIPYLMAPDAEGLKTIFHNQDMMLTYHGKTVLGSTHSFSSKWYEWIIIKRPIWFYSGTVSSGVKEGISSFGNPLVWWVGIPAFFWLLFNAITKKDKVAIFLCFSYLMQLIPWVGVERLTFIYHYFPCVPFIVLMIGYSIKTLYDEAKNKKAVFIGAFVYTGLVIALFILFYPVLSGQPCSTEFAEHFLKWFDSWVLL